jgi:hypothetical protein
LSADGDIGPVLLYDWDLLYSNGFSRQLGKERRKSRICWLSISTPATDGASTSSILDSAASNPATSMTSPVISPGNIVATTLRFVGIGSPESRRCQ